MPESFLLEDRFINALKIILAGYTFAAGMPLCYPCIFLSLCITFWCHKYIVVNYARKPALYSIGLIKSCNNVIPAAIVIHLLFGMY